MSPPSTHILDGSDNNPDKFVVQQPVKTEMTDFINVTKDIPGDLTPDDCTTQDGEEITDLIYGIEDCPPWYLCILLGFQQYLTYCGALLANTIFLLPMLCIGFTSPARALILSTAAFTSGIATLLQTTLGSRLPILQGPGIVAIIPIIIHLESPRWQCPTNSNMTTGSENDVWQTRMREVQGAIIIAGVFQTILSLTGLVTVLLRVVTPLVLSPVMVLIGLSLFEKAAKICSGSWPCALATTTLIIIFSGVVNKNTFFCFRKNLLELQTKFVTFFKLYSVLLSMGLVWLTCAVLTSYDVLAKDSVIRTDRKLKALEDAPWFRMPYPGQWGMPTYSAAAVFGMVGAVLASVIDSIGDYYSCAKVSGAPPPPDHAFNRGIFMEGIASLLSGIVGSGFSCVSYTGPIGVIGITKVGSRRVAQTAAIMMLIFGIICKFSAFFIMIPEPILGGVFIVVFGSMVTIGLSYLDTVKIRSRRNLTVIGMPLFFGLAFPGWVAKNKAAIATGYESLDATLALFLSTSMFVGGLLALVLDNVIPGTDEERGIVKSNIITGQETDIQKPFTSAQECYDLPYCMDFLRKCSISRYVCISPTYKPGSFSLRSCSNKISMNKQINDSDA